MRFFLKDILRDAAGDGSDGGGAGDGQQQPPDDGEQGGKPSDGDDDKPGQGEDDGKAELARLRKENEQLKTRAEENEQTARHWYEQAQGTKGKASKAKEEPEEEDPLDGVDLLEAATDSKKFRQVLKKAGFVSKDEVDQMVQQRATSIQREAQILKDYPEMADQESDFFKAVVAEYGKLTKSGIPKVDAMERAAEKVELKMWRDGKRKPKADQDAEERRSRKAAQQGDPGRGGAGREDDGDTELSAEQKKYCEAFGISEDAYKKRAKEGITVRGLGGR